MLLCLGLAWLITNGWSYIALGLGIYYNIGWLQAVASAYLTFLWFPFTPEKILTVMIAIFFLKCFFPKDEKTLGILKDMFQRIKAKHNERKKRKSDRAANGEMNE